jgi:hypothetical protein
VDACRSETDSRPLNGLFSPELESTLSLVQITENANPQDRPTPREIPFVGWPIIPIHSESVKLMRKIRLGFVGFVGLLGFVGTGSRALWVELKFGRGQ